MLGCVVFSSPFCIDVQWDLTECTSLLYNALCTFWPFGTIDNGTPKCGHFLGPRRSVLIREVSRYQGEKNTYSRTPLNNHPWCKDTLSRKVTLLCPKVSFLVQIDPWDKDTPLRIKAKYLSPMVASIEGFHCISIALEWNKVSWLKQDVLTSGCRHLGVPLYSLVKCGLPFLCQKVDPLSKKLRSLISAYLAVYGELIVRQ